LIVLWKILERFPSLPNKGRKAKRRRGQKPVTTSKEFCQIKEVIRRVKPHSGGHSHNNLCLRVILKIRKFLKSAAQTFPCSQKRSQGEPGTYTGALAFLDQGLQVAIFGLGETGV
jgi:hypothetical protein